MTDADDVIKMYSFNDSFTNHLGGNLMKRWSSLMKRPVGSAFVASVILPPNLAYFKQRVSAEHTTLFSSKSVCNAEGQNAYNAHVQGGLPISIQCSFARK